MMNWKHYTTAVTDNHEENQEQREREREAQRDGSGSLESSDSDVSSCLLLENVNCVFILHFQLQKNNMRSFIIHYY